MRVQILKDYVRQHFPATPLLDYALEVEKITTSKVTKEKLPGSLMLRWTNLLEEIGARLHFDYAAKSKPSFLEMLFLFRN